MAGSLEKRGENSWRMVYFKGRDQDGKRIRYTRPFKGSKPQAEKALAKFVTEIESGLVGDGENMYFRDLCDRWLSEYANEHLSPKTIEDYTKIISKRLKPAFGQFRLRDIKPLAIIKFYRELRAPAQRLDGQKKDNKPKSLSGATIQKYHRVLSSIFSTAVQWQLIAMNPCDRVEVPKKEHTETSFYDEEQLTAMLDALTKEPLKFQCMIILATLTGLRRGELVGLTWDDINFEEGSLTVSKQAQYVSKTPPPVKTTPTGTVAQSGFDLEAIYELRPKMKDYIFSPSVLLFSKNTDEPLTFNGISESGQNLKLTARVLTSTGLSISVSAESNTGMVTGVIIKFKSAIKGHGIIIREPKTKSSCRTIALPVAALSILKEHKKVQAEERLKIADIWHDTNHIFTTWDGEIMHPDTPSSWFADFIKRNKLPHIRFHDLRHSSATILLGNGVPLKNVSARLGHSTASVTANIYAHALKSIDRQAAEKFDQIMKRGQA